MRAKKAPGGPEQLKAAAEKRRLRESRKTATLQPLWYQTDDPSKAAEAANEAISQWMVMDQRRIYDLSYYATLYGRTRLGFSGTLTNLSTRTFNTRTRLVNSLAATFNGCKSVVDTLSNTVAQHKPVVQFAASDGDWKSHKVAKGRGRFVAGWFYEQAIYKKTAIAFRDSGVWGTGIIHVYAKNGRAVAERVFAGDLFINQASCITNTEPLEMGRVRLIDRHQAWAMFEGNPEAQKAILDAEQVKLTVDSMISSSDDLIQLNEMWRLPSYDGAGDGKHLMATTSDVLELCEWKHPNFPFAFVDCSPRMFGFWPGGMVEDLQDLQLQYNDLSYSINEAIELAGRFRLFVDSNSNVNVEAIDNEIGGILRADGAPKSLLWEAVQPEVYARLEKLERQFYTQSGVAQMVANQEKVDPNESGIAIRERIGVYDERHALWQQSYQDMHLMLARLAIQTIEDILQDEEEKSYEVYTTKGPQSEPIDFADLAFKPDEQYVLTAMPVNDLPDTVEGRVALAQEFINAGWYDEATAREVFLAPYDVRRVETLFNASFEYFSKILDAAIEDGDEPPDPEGNDQLTLALNMALQHLAYAKLRGVAESRCDLIRAYILKVKARMMEAQDGAAANQPPAPAPLANPQAPPTSGLVPNPNAPPPAQ